MIEVHRSRDTYQVSDTVTAEQLSRALSAGMGIRRLPADATMKVQKTTTEGNFLVTFSGNMGVDPRGCIVLDDGTSLPIGSQSLAVARAATPQPSAAAVRQPVSVGQVTLIDPDERASVAHALASGDGDDPNADTKVG